MLWSVLLIVFMSHGRLELNLELPSNPTGTTTSAEQVCNFSSVSGSMYVLLSSCHIALGCILFICAFPFFFCAVYSYEFKLVYKPLTLMEHYFYTLALQDCWCIYLSNCLV